jgi:glycosyltransferase involved in cell wall biosynthesis
MSQIGAPTKILHVIPSVTPKNGGPSEAIARMVSALREVSVETHVITTDYDGRGERLSPQARATLAARLGPVHFARKWWDAYTFAPGMIGWLFGNGRNFDLLHIHALFSFSSTLSAAYAIVRGKPYVVRPLGTLARYGLQTRRARAKRVSLTLIERPILARASAVHCTSEAERQDVLAVCPSANAIVIPLSVEMRALAHDEEETANAQTNQSLRLLYLSRLDPKKNVEVLLDAFAKLVERSSIAELVIAGDGDAAYVASLKERADELRISDRVRWLGHVAGEVKAKVFRSAYAFVLPSQSENFGIAVAEALAAGLPCVVSPHVAIAPEIERYGAGLVVSPEPDELADALARLIEQPLQRATCARAARQLARDEYSDAKLGERLQNLYQDILAREVQSAVRQRV